jgi:predicted nuclease of restriction endonuclease-like (RecB) superfamily
MNYPTIGLIGGGRVARILLEGWTRAKKLPPPQSDLAQQTLKGPYVFDFLTLDGAARERELEQGLADHIQKFLVSLGAGFAFVGRQTHLAVEGEDYYLDLLFYHLKLQCFVLRTLNSRGAA